MLYIILEIMFNWVAMGMLMWLVLAGSLYFAIFCEKVVDYFTPAK